MYRLMMLVVGFTFTAVAASAGFQPYFHTVKAKNGDAISTLLSKYELSVHSCNTEKFYELNGIKRGAKLFAGKEYKLPIKVYQYNGKSIRTTLKIEDINDA
ncbi:MAG TPA: hypothetical protein PLQ57_16395, partial [Saprospiraceae bacterium]|nr:hypothetical protein [Saprospiraceae bacterium]